MTSHKTVFFFVLPLVSVMVVALLPAAADQQTATAEKEQHAAKPQRSVPDEQKTQQYFTDLPLLTQDGKSVRFYTDVLKDRVVLINFLYTNCKDACPLMTQMLIQVRDRLGEMFDNPVRFVSISTDPERDSPQALTKFAKQQKADDPGWVFLTGEKKNIDFILKRLGQYSPNVEGHSTMMLAGNVRTRHWIKIMPMTPVPAILAKLQTLASES
ncbi:MAG: SCO family protein [Planctomycetota bacterium]